MCRKWGDPASYDKEKGEEEEEGRRKGQKWGGEIVPGQTWAQIKSYMIIKTHCHDFLKVALDVFLRKIT